MNEKTWKECCQIAIEELTNVGITTIEHDKALRRWHIMFRNGELFHLPNSRKQREPKSLVLFPESQELITRYCNNEVKLGSLSVENVTVEIRTKIIPTCHENLLEESGEDKDSMPSHNEILSMCDLKTVSVKTAWRWILHLGCKCCENKRSHCSDGHERKDVLKDGNERFLVQCFKIERRTHRWAQLTNEQAMQLEESDEKFPEDCCCYDLISEKRECHVDTHRASQEFAPEECKKFGGGLSCGLKEGERPVMVVGQDESAFHQCTFAKKQWKGPRGQALLLPKSTGEIHMVSGYQARKFGLGLGDKMTEEALKEVNRKREGKKYFSEDDAKLIFNSEFKKPLTSDPCLRFFRAGQNDEGHWTSSHAKLQLEDVADVLSIICPDTDFAFKFDQLSGHTKMRKNGLSTRSVNVSHGGKASEMRSAMVKEVEF